jgi:hypothetical protein
MNEIIKFLKNHPAYHYAGRGTGLMSGTVIVKRKDKRNKYDKDVIFFCRPLWVTEGPIGRLP